MKKIKLYIVATLAVFAVLSSCKTTETTDEQEQQPAQISGSLTRSGSTSAPTISYPLGITAKLNGQNYLNNVLATMAATTGKITFNTGAWYYPLNKSDLKFYACTNPAAYSNNIMTLTSGIATINDALLSSNNGAGTPGSATSQVTQLVFSHLMTKLDVNVVIDDPELTGWTPTNFRFTMTGAVTTGQYNITAATGTASTNNGSTLYSIQPGTNYIVPNGAVIGSHLTSLIIDDYTASASDLTRFTISQIAGSPTSFVLSPGKAYVLTFKIKRLGVEQILLTLGNWTNVNIPDDDINYVAETLNLHLGSYTAQDITKLTVVDNNDKFYTASVANSVATFVNAPTTIKSASIYTASGLLSKVDFGVVLTGNDLHLDNLNQYGMLPVSPLVAYDPVTNPYAVTTVEQFKKIDGTMAYSYRQMVNIYMQNVQAPSIDMAGSYDGNGFQIHGINILGSGLFKEIRSGQTVKNVRISAGCVVQSGSDSYVGGLCGKNSGTIVACANEAIVTSATAKHMGGICGDNAGQIVGCMNAGDIKGIYGTGSYIGGICGYNSYTGAGNAIVSTLNVGTLRPTGTYQSGNVAGICGNSVNGAQFATSYWLTGTAEPIIGTPEVGVNGSSLTITDLADLSQQRIREPQTLLNLNQAIPAPWSAFYNFTMVRRTWPMPVKL